MALPRFPVAVLSVAASSAFAFAVACGDNSPAAETPGGTDNGAKPSASSSASSSPTTTPTSSGVPDATVSPPDGQTSIGPVTPVRFVAFGDTGKGCSNSADPQCAVADAIKNKCATDGCDFAVLLGDNIYPSGAASPDDPIFQKVFEEPYKDLNFPFYVALGNHDYGHDGAGTDFAKAQNEVDYTQKSQKWKLPSKHYRQVFGNGALELFVADTNMAMFGQEAAQRATLKSWIASSTAIWKIAVGHHPYKSNGRHGNAGQYDCYDVPGIGCVSVPPSNGETVKSFLEDVVCGKTDFYLCGHDHNRQWLSDTCNGTELVVSGGGSSTTELEGKNPTHVQKDTSGFFYISIDGKTLKGEFIDATGNVDFSRTITKP
jgi:tartrate-resistant acid phosphatase type 5